MGQAGLGSAAGAGEPVRVDLGFGGDSADDELVGDLPVERPPWAAAASGAKLAEPVGAPHGAAVRVGKGGAEGGELRFGVGEGCSFSWH